MQKKHNLSFSTTTGFCLMCLLLSPSAKAVIPVFNYNFPASYGGTGTVVTDQSSAGNNGHTTGTLTLSSDVPAGAVGTRSVNTASGGILTTGNSLLNNSAIASDGGFGYNVAFKWNGTDSTSFGHTEKLVDYAGTESLQLITSAGSANLQMLFGDDTGAETIAVSTTILPNTWYSVALTFDSRGNTTDGNGDITGTVSMVVNGAAAITGTATKGTYGDSLNRPIGIANLGANFGHLVGFNGLISDPNVVLAPVPEPSSLALGLMGGAGVLGMMWNARRRKA